MHTLDELRAHNREISDLLDVLSVLVEQDNLRSNPYVCELLSRFHDKVWTHLVLDDNELYSELLEQADSKSKAQALQFHDRAREIKKRFGHYVRHWCHPQDRQDTQAFQDESREIFRMLREQIRYEDEKMFPLLAELQGG
jgi:hypothetical protein